MALVSTRWRLGAPLALTMAASAALFAFGAPLSAAAQNAAPGTPAPGTAASVDFSGARVSDVESAPSEQALEDGPPISPQAPVYAPGDAQTAQTPPLRPIQPVATPIYDSPETAEAAASKPSGPPPEPAPAPVLPPEAIAGPPATIGEVLLDPTARALAEQERAEREKAAQAEAARRAEEASRDDAVQRQAAAAEQAAREQAAAEQAARDRAAAEQAAREQAAAEQAARDRAAAQEAARAALAQPPAASAPPAAGAAASAPQAVAAPPPASAPPSSQAATAPLGAPARPVGAQRVSATRPQQPPAGAGGAAFQECAECPEMVALPGGRFEMGAPETEAGRAPSEGPTRMVAIARFAMGKFEVTRAEWGACAASGYCRSLSADDLSASGDPLSPAAGVSWSDVVEGARPGLGFIAWLNSQVVGSPYRLPSEAEWEYAVRAGVAAPYWTGETIPSAAAHFNAGAGGAPGSAQPVGAVAPNPFGLHDMQGNVWEWTADCFAPDHRGAPNSAAPRRDGDCAMAPLRGGAWDSPASALRAAARRPALRTEQGPSIGFRVARSLP